MKELIEKLHKDDMLWFFMANLVSADVLNNEHDCESSLLIIREIEDCLKDETLDIDSETKDKLSDLLMKSKEIVEKEYSRFKPN